MIKKYFGKSRAGNLDWLAHVWLKQGPPVCFLQGFAGVGKTDLARDLRELAEKQGNWQQAVINEVADRAMPSVLESLMELSLVLSQQGLPEMEQVLFEQRTPNLAHALEKALERPVVIILDEAQRFFRVDSGAPLPEINGVLEFLRNRPKLAGRLLLLSDRSVEEARWSEWIPKRTLTKLEPDEAIEAFQTKLAEAGVVVEIAAERMQEVVRDLDFNPRAIEALVGALRHDSLDEIIESNPGLWAVRDREISRDFLKSLERDLLHRTMRHLDEVHQRKLWRLAVHRRSFKREALEKLCGSKDEATEFRSILVTRFLLNFYKGALALNPIVREISLAHLRENTAELRQAHSGAADYHLRVFKAKQIVGSQSILGESFAELRYHLVQAGREGELSAIGQRFTDHMKQQLKGVPPVPTDREELDERIGVLSVLLGKGGAKGLEYHLACCFKRRGKVGDIGQAIVHAERATGIGAPVDSWVLLARLQAQVSGVDAAMKVINTALELVSAKSNLVDVYQSGAEILAAAGNSGAAVALLNEGIKVVPPDKNLFALYQTCADLLSKAGKTDDAVALLEAGIEVIPPDKGLFSLYQICANLLSRAGKTDDAVALLNEGIRVIPPEKNLVALYQICANLFSRAGKADDAVALLKAGIEVIPPDKGLFTLYLELNLILCRAGTPQEAIGSLREGLQRVPEQFGRYRLAESALLHCAAAADIDQLVAIIEASGPDSLPRSSIALGRVLLLQHSGDWNSAAELAKEARAELGGGSILAAHEAFSRLADTDAEGALRALLSFSGSAPRAGDSTAWLLAFIQLRRCDRAAASAALRTYLGRAINESHELNEAFLLRLWDQREFGPETHLLSLQLPIMPASLTGLDHSVRRIAFAPPVLPAHFAADAGTITAPGLASGMGPPEVYVSYAWGEDSTEAGRQREEIVDRLCAVIERRGLGIGRDKARMRGGDSIQQFAHEISKAARIVAVISEKSLHSEFCMAHELFRAFRRCDYQRAEFQKKVIALVMDDARPFLKDNRAIVALAKTWLEKLEVLRNELRLVDPEKKSADVWVFVDLMEDMCPRLPAMLAALNDIVMKRGFDAIVKDGFKEVINLLPLKDET